MKKALAYLICSAVYFILGEIYLKIAIPPGFSSAIWIPIGFSCAAIFVAGSQVAIVGTFIGSFLVNLHHLSPLNITQKAESFFLALIIALGSSLAILQGSYFIKKYGRLSQPNSQKPLHSELRSIYLLFYIGLFPVSKSGQNIGFLISIFDTQRLISTAMQKSDLSSFEIEFTDQTAQKSSCWRNDSFSSVERSLQDGLISHSYVFPVLDHKWKLQVATTRTDLYKGLPSATILNLFFGLVFAFFVSALQLILYLRVKKAENASA